MKTTKAFYVLIGIGSLILLTACPVSTSYPLITAGKCKVDKSILGFWKNDSADAEAKEIKVSKSSDSTYGISVTNKGSMYMADADTFNAWIGKLGDNDYLVLQEVDGTAVETYYVYNYKKLKDKIITSDISLKVKGTDAVVSIKDYQEEVLASSKMTGFLSGEIIWHR